MGTMFIPTVSDKRRRQIDNVIFDSRRLWSIQKGQINQFYVKLNCLSSLKFIQGMKLSFKTVIRNTMINSLCISL